MKSITIPQIEIEIGENLFLCIKDLKFTPFKKGYISGPPEDCYEDEGAEADWEESNTFLVLKKKIYVNTHHGKKVYRTDEIKFNSKNDFNNEYYDAIIEACEEYLKSE